MQAIDLRSILGELLEMEILAIPFLLDCFSLPVAHFLFGREFQSSRPDSGDHCCLIFGQGERNDFQVDDWEDQRRMFDVEQMLVDVLGSETVRDDRWLQIRQERIGIEL